MTEERHIILEIIIVLVNIDLVQHVFLYNSVEFFYKIKVLRKALKLMIETWLKYQVQIHTILLSGRPEK